MDPVYEIIYPNHFVYEFMGRPPPTKYLPILDGGGLAPLLGVYSWPGLSLGYQHLAWAKKIKDRGVFDGFRKIDPFWEHLLYLVGLWGCLGVSWVHLEPLWHPFRPHWGSLGLLGGTLGSHGLHFGPFLAHQVRPNLTIGTSERGPSGHRAKLTPEGVWGTTPKWILCMK